MRDYEFFVILKSDLEKEEKEQVLERIQSFMYPNHKAEERPEFVMNHWGERKLKYPIKKNNLGDYYLMEAPLDPQNVRPIENALGFMEEVLRYLIVRKEAVTKFRFDYKDEKVLQDYTNEHGQILPRRRTRLSAKQQTSLARAIKRARHLALLPFIDS